MLALTALAACGGSVEEHLPPIGADTTQVTSEPVPAMPKEDVASGACTTGEVRECKVMLGNHGTVVNCFVGIQYCVGATWAPCHDPKDD